MGAATGERFDTYRAVTDRLLDLERERDLFEVSIRGVPVWERLRHAVANELLVRTGVLSSPHAATERSARNYLAGLKNQLKYTYYRNPLFGDECDLLFFGTSRRKQLDDGLWWDIYCDPIMAALDRDTAMIENPYQMGHRWPTPTDSRYFLDFVQYLSKERQLIARRRDTFAGEEASTLGEVSDALSAAFGVTLDVHGMVRDELIDRKTKRSYYGRVLDRMDPEAVCLVCSYGAETFVEACKEREVPVIELQHGAIHPYHFGYSYPDGREKTAFPDYLFTFGEYWSETVEYPIPDERVRPVGYPHLERRAGEYDAVTPREQVVFVSQGTVGADLSRLAVDLASGDACDHDVVYKLHPGEYPVWREDYPWLVDADVSVVAGDDPPLYRLFAESTAQVGVASTALYEGLCFGLDTYVANLPSAETVAPLIERDAATLVDSAEELATALTAGGETAVSTEYYFEPESIDAIRAEIDRIVG